MDKKYQGLAQNMVDVQLHRRGIQDRAVLKAMANVPRHRFVPDANPQEAYSDHPLATAQGQTISQPYMVGMMTEQLGVEPGLRILEIGAGSGYQAAVFAYMGAQVVTIERSTLLASRARKVLQELGWTNQVEIIEADGTLGWPPAAPYDRVIVTAGAPHLPKAYRDQLADPGRIVIPIGPLKQQNIVVYDQQGDSWSQKQLIACKFVPLIGQDGWPPDDEPETA